MNILTSIKNLFRRPRADLSLWQPEQEVASPEATAWRPDPSSLAMDYPLLTFGPGRQDWWTLADSFQGSIVFGGTGSGKTSGPGRLFARAFLAEGFGGLVLCAKADEAELWKRLAKECGREQDLIIFGPGNGTEFNFLEYELSQPECTTFSLLATFFQIHELASRKNGAGKGDDFWERAMKRLLAHSIEVVTAATGTLRMADLLDFLTSRPASRAEAADDVWQKNSYCAQILKLAEEKCRPEKKRDIERAIRYFLVELAELNDRTRSGIEETLRPFIETFLQHPFRDLFSSGISVSPDDIRAGKIVVVDLPVKRYNEAGAYSNVIWKFALQRAAERRPGAPIFLWADECQMFVTSYDQLFSTTARSSRVATVYLTQNVSNLYAEMGGDASGKARVESLLGNLQTRIFCQNGEVQTNQWGAEAIGKRLLRRESGGKNKGMSMGMNGSPNFNLSGSSGWSEQMDFIVQPREFTEQLTGGPATNFLVSAIVTRAGAGARPWSNGESYLQVFFPQMDMLPPKKSRISLACTTAEAERMLELQTGKKSLL